MKEGTNAFAYISIVAIVGIVAILVMFAGSDRSVTQTPSIGGDVLGDARRVSPSVSEQIGIEVDSTMVEALIVGSRSSINWGDCDMVTVGYVQAQGSVTCFSCWNNIPGDSGVQFAGSECFNFVASVYG